MRNELKYPITTTEAVQFLEALQKQLMNEERIGDIRPALLDRVINTIRYYGLRDS